MSQNLGDVVVLEGIISTNSSFTEKHYDGGRSYTTIRTFTSNHLIATQQLNLSGIVYLWNSSNSSYSHIILDSPKIIFDTFTPQAETYSVSIQDNSFNSITFNNASVNFDGAIYDDYAGYQGRIAFTGTSSINITSNTNGKTIIKASTLTGTVSLDVDSGVQDGDTFLIEATDNQLVITDGEWTATPSTSGNITTYTLAKSILQKPKFRLLYTVS